MQPALCSCMAATFNEANSRLSIIGACLSGEICDLSELQLEIVDSVEDFRCLDSHKVMECLRRILSLDNFARSLVTEKRLGYFKCGTDNKIRGIFPHFSLLLLPDKKVRENSN